MKLPMTSRTQNPLSAILTPPLLSYCTEITFPWPLSTPLSGTEVAFAFFGQDTTLKWSVPEVKIALLELSRLGLPNISVSDLVSILGDPTKELQTFLHRSVAIILLLDQGPRHLCKGVDARYTYDYFGVLARNLVSHFFSLPPTQNPYNLTTWTSTGIELSHGFLRISMLLAPLCHSDIARDHSLHLQLESSVRQYYEIQTNTIDPYRQTFTEDTNDIYLAANMLEEGPLHLKGSMDKAVSMRIEQFVYWMMRYFTAHVAYVEWFGRSPFRNCAVGRRDREGEKEWLDYCGIVVDEGVRERVRRDIEGGGWRPLEL